MEEKNNKFEYSYSAPSEEERREIAAIRRQYEEHPASPEGKLMRIRRLDKTVRSVSTAVGISLGVLGLLIFGLGMAMVLEWSLWLTGVFCGAFGACVIIATYPVYRAVLSHYKKKYADEILLLSEELLK